MKLFVLIVTLVSVAFAAEIGLAKEREQASATAQVKSIIGNALVESFANIFGAYVKLNADIHAGGNVEANIDAIVTATINKENQIVANATKTLNDALDQNIAAVKKNYGDFAASQKMYIEIITERDSAENKIIKSIGSGEELVRAIFYHFASRIAAQIKAGDSSDKISSATYAAEKEANKVIVDTAANVLHLSDEAISTILDYFNLIVSPNTDNAAKVDLLGYFIYHLIVNE